MTPKHWLALAGLATASLAHAAVVGTARPSDAAASAAITISDTPPPQAVSKSDRETIVEARSLIQDGQPQEAITRVLDPFIAALEARYRDQPGVLYCANSQAEALFYLVKESTQQHAATVLDGAWCDAYFMRGFAQFDLGRLDLAEADYARALALEPENPHVLSEMGDMHLRHKDWPGAITYFEHAIEATKTFGAEERKTAETTRALRGVGYADVELGRLEDAEARYARCLEIDPHDEKARAELAYVKDLRAKRGG